MKRILTMLVLLSISMGFKAQDNLPVMAVPSGPLFEAKPLASADGHITRDIQDAVFTEDFANGLDGNNELNQPWTVGGANADLWRHDTQGATDQWSIETNTNIPLESESAENGYMLFTPAEYNEPIFNSGQPWETVSGWLQSPVMDLSALNSVLVDYTIYYRYCCYSPSPIKLGVSVDEGVSWTYFNAYNYGQFIEIAKNFSETIQVTTDISSVAANQSNVMIRFSYNDPVSTIAEPNYGFYFMGVDDVSIRENPFVNNLQILQVMNGDVSNLWEFKNIPLEQSSEIYLGAVYGNFGSATQTGVEVVWDILDGETVLHSSSISLGEVPTTRTDASGSIVQNIDTAWVSSGYIIDQIGNYTIRASIEATEEEEVPLDNQLDRGIKITQNVMSHDDMDLLDVGIGPRDSEEGSFLFEEIGFGAIFFIPNPGSQVYGLQVAIDSATSVGGEYFVELHEYNSAEGPNASADNMPSDSPIDEIEFIVEESQLGTSVFVPFLDPSPLSAGTTYMLVVRQFEGDEQLRLRGTQNTDTDNSSWVREISGSGDYAWFSRPTELAVRMGFDVDVSVNEQAKEELKLSVSPNPASDFVSVRYSLDEATPFAYTLYDSKGAVILGEQLGTQPAGEAQFEFDVLGLKEGLYHLIFRAGETVASEKIVISK
jgi:hypothetical protein